MHWRLRQSLRRFRPDQLPPAEPGKLNSPTSGAILAELLPENAIVSDEGATQAARRC
jgi:hypothetical protein